MHERRLDTMLGKLAVFDLGHGPAALLWPSLFVDHRSLLPIAEALAGSRRCILIDGPGHGRSAAPDRRYTLLECGRAAEQVMDTLGVDAVDWIGNAWGGHVGVRMAVSAPSRVRTLTVIGSPMNALPWPLRWKTRFGLALLALGMRDVVGRMIAATMISAASPTEHHLYVCRCIRDAPKGGIHQAVQSISLGRPDLTPELARIAVPTLLLTGADDVLWPPAVAERHAAEIPDARFETVPSAAHLAPLEQPRETVELIAAFLASRSIAVDRRRAPL